MPLSSRTRSFAAASRIDLASTMATFFRTDSSFELESSATKRSKNPLFGLPLLLFFFTRPVAAAAAADVLSSSSGVSRLRRACAG
eukprot:CAMPEP_0171651590 /NCGR_PEP_ID=MMETSP0990-20121206/38418_1 /TAXON_ID=483369 /ORGANISM="non described non described, Strain CCMP2098" /LENGTH=84 /DNA_ID=CAMNT_0012230585 /DNA_START=156 /DNA_END=410 /DNA_ORIENTATION=-